MSIGYCPLVSESEFGTLMRRGHALEYLRFFPMRAHVIEVK